MTRNGIKRAVLPFSLAVALLGLSSCQSPTPATRIQENPVAYQSLSEKDKALVQMGQIREGMTPQAVFLAWGAPNSQPYEGQKNGKHVVRWVYTTLEPVTVTRWGGPYWGPYGWYDGYGGMMTDTAFVPRNAAYVTFENGKVASWEARRP